MSHGYFTGHHPSMLSFLTNRSTIPFGSMIQEKTRKAGGSLHPPSLGSLRCQSPQMMLPDFKLLFVFMALPWIKFDELIA